MNWSEAEWLRKVIKLSIACTTPTSPGVYIPVISASPEQEKP